MNLQDLTNLNPLGGRPKNKNGPVKVRLRRKAKFLDRFVFGQEATAVLSILRNRKYLRFSDRKSPTKNDSLFVLFDIFIEFACKKPQNFGQFLSRYIKVKKPSWMNCMMRADLGY